MTFLKTFKYCLLPILLIIAYGHTLDEVDEASLDDAPLDETPICAHGLYELDADTVEVDEDFIVDDGRNLATTTYPAFRMKADFTRLTQGTAEFKDYVENDLVPPVIDYFQSALDIKQPLTSNLRITGSTICGGYATPTLLKNGVKTDFFVLVTSTEDSLNWVASAGACSLSSATKRPLIARMMFNLIYTKSAKNDILLHERNMYLTMHEMMHALGFAASSFKNFIDSKGKTLTGHIKTVTVNGGPKWTALDVEPLTSKLRAHFGCSSLPGAFMEDQGGSGTEGSHFERRHFVYEVMTSGVIHGRRISEFSLAVLEGSGWYMPNYTYAEPFFFGQGQGCNFLYQNCTASTFNFEDFCTGSSRGCTQVGRGGGVCSTDTRSNDCRYNIPNVNYDCENPDAASYARHPSREVFGRTAGSKCFSGTLTTAKSSTQTSFCFKFNCVGTGLSTKLEVMVGSTKVTCTKESQVKVTGLNGVLDCPDPLTYCNTVGKKYCPRGCLGRGTCVNNQCKCKTGYTGVDCALKA